MSHSRPALKRAFPEEALVAPTKRPRLDTASVTTASQGNDPVEIVPIILADCPKHQALWDRIPVGTLFEIARIANLKEIDLAAIPRERLQILTTTNVASMSKLLSVLRCDSVLPMEKQAAEALDFEALSIVAGDGKMLEHEEASKNISGKVHFIAALSLDALFRKSGLQSPSKSSPSKSPQKSSGKVVEPVKETPILSLRRPQFSGSCLFTRVFGSHRFLRVKILERTKPKYRGDAYLAQLYEWSLRPIYILGRIFRAFVEKDNTIWYYLEGSDRVGSFAQGPLSPGRYGLGSEVPDVEALVNWWIPLKHNRDQLMCKLITRLHLGISGTRPGPLIAEVKLCKDIVRKVGNRKVVFTDGSGVISESLAAKFRTKTAANRKDIPPSYQIRLSTSKGVVQVAPEPDDAAGDGDWIQITESMLKAKHEEHIPAGPIGGMSILGAAHHLACVVKPATCRYPARLSAQLIPILWEQGVPLSAIEELQRKSIMVMIKELAIPSAGTSDENRPETMAFAKAIQRYANLVYHTLLESKAETEISGKPKFDEKQDRKWMVDDLISSLDQEDGNLNHADMILGRNVQLYLAVICGLNIKGTSYFMSIWNQLVKKAVQSHTMAFKIGVPGSVYCTIVPDFTGRLREGEISFNPPASMNIDGVDFTTGNVLVGRHPAYLPTDVRKAGASFFTQLIAKLAQVQLANIPVLRERRGVIFFSIKGSRPLADILAGGDYDGDDVILIWEPSLVDSFENAAEHLSEKPASVAASFERDVVTAGAISDVLQQMHDDRAERVQVLTKHLLGSLKIPQLLGLYNSFFIRAVHVYGLSSEEARVLGHKFNTLIDAPRTSFRLTVRAVVKDREDWDRYSDPLWKRKKDQYEYHKEEKNEGLVLPNVGRVNALDQLYLKGARYHEEVWKDVIGADGGECIYDPAQNTKLAFKWHFAEEEAKDNPAMQRELTMIKNAVETFQGEYRSIQAVYKSKGLKFTAERNAKILDLAHRFLRTPSAKSVPIVTGQVDDTPLDKVRASYAYVVDAQTYSGGINTGSTGGFCWVMAIAPLLNAISSSPITVSFPNFAMLTPHPSFCEVREPRDQP